MGEHTARDGFHIRVHPRFFSVPACNANGAEISNYLGVDGLGAVGFCNLSITMLGVHSGGAGY